MANLGLFEIDTQDAYEDLETLTGITFAEESIYVIQPHEMEKPFVICESNSAPTKGGNIIKTGLTKFKKYSSNFYVKGKGILNISVQEEA